jgi:hypothetical protein
MLPLLRRRHRQGAAGSDEQARRGRRALVLTGLALVILGVSASSAAAQLNVYVGYADNLRATAANFPTPFDSSPGVVNEGCSSSCSLDGGAIRIVNTGFSPETINSTTVNFGGCVFDIWPHSVTVPGGSQLVLPQTASGAGNGCAVGTNTGPQTLDSSDFGPGGAPWAGQCTNSNVIPVVSVTVGGTTKNYSDTGQVLNTGGVDLASCPPGTSNNESTQWTQIGFAPCPSASLTLAPATQTDAVGSTATVVATLTNSGGPDCGQPLQGVTVDFTGSGPNSPISGSGTTNGSGQATFSYVGHNLGTDTLQATVTNAAGTIPSNTVTVTWGTPVRAGSFSCRATAANILGSALVVANPADSPCANASKSLLSLSLGGTALGVLNASTSVHGGRLPAAGDNGTAKASAASLITTLIPGHTIRAGVVTSQATVGCVSNPAGGLSTVMTSSSNVASLTIDGKSYVVGNGPLTIPVGTLATVYVNRTIVTANSRTQRAIEIDLNGKPIVIAAQSEVDRSGNPCGVAII